MSLPPNQASLKCEGNAILHVGDVSEADVLFSTLLPADDALAEYRQAIEGLVRIAWTLRIYRRRVDHERFPHHR